MAGSIWGREPLQIDHQWHSVFHDATWVRTPVSFWRFSAPLPLWPGLLPTTVKLASFSESLLLDMHLDYWLDSSGQHSAKFVILRRLHVNFISEDAPLDLRGRLHSIRCCELGALAELRCWDFTLLACILQPTSCIFICIPHFILDELSSSNIKPSQTDF